MSNIGGVSETVQYSTDADHPAARYVGVTYQEDAA